MDYEVNNPQLEPERLEILQLQSSVYVANDVKWTVDPEEPKVSGRNHAESDTEKLQNEIRMERDKEAEEWNRASAKAMMANHKTNDRLIIFEHKLRKINQLLSFNYYEMSTVNRKVSSTVLSLNTMVQFRKTPFDELRAEMVRVFHYCTNVFFLNSNNVYTR